MLWIVLHWIVAPMTLESAVRTSEALPGQVCLVCVWSSMEAGVIVDGAG